MKEQSFWKKIIWFQFLFSFFVIWCHSENSALFSVNQAATDAVLGWEPQVVRYLGRLGVAGFYLCSGYLFYRNFTLGKLPGKWKSRLRTLLLPYLIWNFIYLLLHWAVLRIPRFKELFADQEIQLNVRTILDALINYRYNPVFWYLQYLIILVALCPLLYVLLKNRYVGIIFLVGLLFLQSGAIYQIQSGFWSPVLNWMFIYAAGAYAGIHLRKRIEGTPPPILLLVASVALALLCAELYSLYANVVFSLLYFLTAPICLALFVLRIPLPEPGEWMKNTFFVYASHHILVRTVTKLCAKAFPGNVTLAWILFLGAPLYAYMVAWLFQKLCSGRGKALWNLLTGGR